MAWKQVKVKVGSAVHIAQQNDNELHLSSEISVGDDVNIDGKKVAIESQSLILRGEINKIILAVASPKKEKLENGNKQAQG